MCASSGLAAAVKLGPMAGADRPIGVDRSELDGGVRAGGDFHVSPQADRRVQRRRAVVEEIQRPDVDRTPARSMRVGRTP
jgi:hypothetical protein